MEDHIDDLLRCYPEVKETSPTPATKSLFGVDEQSKLLDKDQKELFHSSIAKSLFIAKRARPDIGMPVSVLSS